MPRTNYLPERDSPIGYAFAYQKPQTEDKPTVEVDFYAKGYPAGFIEAVCLALETWDPVFDHWADPEPRHDQSGAQIQQRKIPVFRGRHADKVLKFRDDVFGYMARTSKDDLQDNVFAKIASKYVHVRPTTATAHFIARPDTTFYSQDVIRPLIRKSDPEWSKVAWMIDIHHMHGHGVTNAHGIVMQALEYYDKARGTTFGESYRASTRALIEDNAHPWEHWRLIAHYVQDLADGNYEGQPVDPWQTRSASVPRARG